MTPISHSPGDSVDELDKLLTTYFHNEVPQTWPAAPAVTPAPVARAGGLSQLLPAFGSRLALAASLAPFNLGSSDGEATECLVLDRDEQVLHVAPVGSAGRLLAGQHPPLPELPAGAFQSAETSLADLLDLARARGKWQEVKIDRAAIERATREEQQAIADMVGFLDQHVK